MSAPHASALASDLGSVDIEHDQRVEIAVSRMKDIGDLESESIANFQICHATRPASGR